MNYLMAIQCCWVWALIPLIAMAKTISDYYGNCPACIYAGYNYCSDDSTCIDNFSNTCYTIIEFPYSCTGLLSCTDVTVSDADLWEV